VDPTHGWSTMDVYFLHLSLSSVILVDSSTGSPVHVLMLSIQAVRDGLPRLRAPGIIPWESLLECRGPRANPRIEDG